MSRYKPPSELLDKFILRMPAGMRERIRELAEQNRRSMNAEIIFQLDRTIYDPLKMETDAALS